MLEKLSQARKQEERDAKKEKPRSAKYEVGDRVRINNAIKTPVGCSVNTRDRTATVLYTKLNKEQTKVFIQTDNGFKTWRLEKNLNNIT